MHFSKFVVASLLALTSSVASQVIITITSTITVVPVTLTPLTTSTSTVFVTVSAKPSTTPKSTNTATFTVTVTANAPATTGAAVCPLALGGSCGLWNPAPGNCRQCSAHLTCKSILWSSSRCETVAQTVYTVTQTVYKA